MCLAGACLPERERRTRVATIVQPHAQLVQQQAQLSQRNRATLSVS